VIMTTNTDQTTLLDVCTPETLSAKHPDLFTISQLGWLLKTRHKNGLADTGAVLKVSQKLYINRSIFLKWFLKQKA